MQEYGNICSNEVAVKAIQTPVHRPTATFNNATSSSVSSPNADDNTVESLAAGDLFSGEKLEAWNWNSEDFLIGHQHLTSFIAGQELCVPGGFDVYRFEE